MEHTIDDELQRVVTGMEKYNIDSDEYGTVLDRYMKLQKFEDERKSKCEKQKFDMEVKEKELEMAKESQNANINAKKEELRLQGEAQSANQALKESELAANEAARREEHDFKLAELDANMQLKAFQAETDRRIDLNVIVDGILNLIGVTALFGASKVIEQREVISTKWCNMKTALFRKHTKN